MNTDQMKSLKNLAGHPDMAVLEAYLLDLSDPDVFSGADYRDIGAHYVARKELCKELKTKLKSIRLLADE